MLALSVFSNLHEVTNNFVLWHEHFTGHTWNFNCLPPSGILLARDAGKFHRIASVLHGHFNLSTLST